MRTIKERTEEYAELERNDTMSVDEQVIKSYTEGALEQQEIEEAFCIQSQLDIKKKFVNDSCKWMQDNAYKYWGRDDFDVDKMISDFHKYITNY